MIKKDNKNRYDDAKRRQDLNVESEQLGVNDKYENNTIIQSPYNYIDNYLVQLIRKKNKKLKFLDYCCGTGLRSRVAAKNGYDCYGIDISKKSIDVAKERIGSIKSSFSKNYTVGNAEDLHFEDEFFDVIISYGSFSYLNLQAAMNEIKRVLKPDGIFIILDTTKNNPIINLKRYIKYRRNIVSKYHIDNLFDMKTIHNLEANFFEFSDTKFFHFLSALLVPIPENRAFIFLKNLSLLIDSFLQKTLVKYFFWKFIIILKNPIKKNNK